MRLLSSIGVGAVLVACVACGGDDDPAGSGGSTSNGGTAGTPSTGGMGGNGAAGGGGSAAGGNGGSGGSPPMTGLWADLDGTPTVFNEGLLAMFNAGVAQTQITGVFTTGMVGTSLSVNFGGMMVGMFDCSAAPFALVTYVGPDSMDNVSSFNSWVAGGTCTIDVTEYGTNIVGTFTADVQVGGGETISFTNGGFNVAVQ